MHVLFATSYLGPVQQYARLYACSGAVEERCESFIKQTYRSRCVILSANGPLALSLPVVHRGGNQPVGGVELSMHGNWQKLHWNALVSAYERSPYFDYYADYLRPFYEHPPRLLVDFNAGLRDTVCRLLGISGRVEPTRSYRREFPGGEDCRTLISPKRDWRIDPHFRSRPYYQVFGAKYGFVPNLSIADLLFNMGPEARLVLRDSYVGDNVCSHKS
ncbi:MAG: WbqC family protein [Alloprevotella sp.]|nr:WbqC family protein [Alloprevotella sp.]